MPSEMDFPARGRVIAVDENRVTFVPEGTNYQLHLTSAAAFTGPLNKPLQAFIRAQARKLWTVPSGGNFITPIFGSPRIVQGRIRYLSETAMVLHAGAPVIIELPSGSNSIDPSTGPLGVGALANATLLAGATFELAAITAAA
jgi:hypothetical protein